MKNRSLSYRGGCPGFGGSGDSESIEPGIHFARLRLKLGLEYPELYFTILLQTVLIDEVMRDMKLMQEG